SLPGGALTNYNGGKTMAHEICHDFNLYHIWGDDNGACTGTDYVADTPNQASETAGAPSGVVTDACTTTAPGIMYQNYMDYTDDRGMEMFTVQQVARMQAAANSYRPGLFTSNACVPVSASSYDAAVTAIIRPLKRVCATDFTPTVTIVNHGSVTITSLPVSAKVDNGTAITTSWTGTLNYLDSVTITLPALTTTTGNHTLTVFTGAPNNVADQVPSDDTLRTTYAYYDAVAAPLTESFEGSAYPPQGWDIVNEDGLITWEKTGSYAKTGSYSAMIRNYNDAAVGAKDYLRLPQLVLPDGDSAFMTFRVAASTPASGIIFNYDTLDLLISSDCGASYQSLYKKWGANLSTTTRSITGAYTPQDGEWRMDSINLTPYIGKGPFMLAFLNTNGAQNNIYLDDINIYSKKINPNLKSKGFLIT
ncbi:MAG: choice-of-anchor J domain-containing protein, partial [Bacteroidetes bacterium]|nr:choice-of-anchor J domain-containing protein [Bacteroidota bacterium]